MNTGIYYEHQGPIKLSVNTWQLVTYHNLTSYLRNENTIETLSEYINVLCNKIYEPTINITNSVDTCINFEKQTKRVLHKIRVNQQHIYQTIGFPTTGKLRRDLLGKLNSIAHTLFGNCDNSREKHYTTQINNSSVGGDFHIHNEHENLRIINLINEINKFETKIKNSINELKNQVKVISERNTSIKAITGNMEYASYLINKIPIINSIINEYIIYVNTLTEIIQSAKIGIVHSSILSPEQIITHLKEIKMTLPPSSDIHN